jgi:hypothetical protein
VAHLLQRIKIARRKGHEEKVSKYMEQLNKLQTGKIQKVHRFSIRFAPSSVQ